MDVKNLIESLIGDLTDDVPMQRISSKAQVIASLLDNVKFKTWVDKELIKGYSNADDLPEYRKFRAMNIVASYVIPAMSGLLQYTNTPVPVENLGEETSDEIYTVKIYDTIPVLERTIKTDDNVHYSVTSYEKACVQKVLGHAQITSVYKQLSIQNFIIMMETVRHQLVEFMLEFNKTLFGNEIDFAVMEKEKKDQIINNIYASIVHTGTGNIDASHSNNIGQGNVEALDRDCILQIEKLLSEIESLKINESEKDDIEQCVSDIRNELKSESPSNRFIRNTLRALKSFGSIVTEQAVGAGIDKLIDKFVI